MSYKLFLDDEREPPSDGSTWVVVRSVLEAMEYIADHGWPKFISFDNDLGKLGLENEGYGFAKWLIDEDFQLTVAGLNSGYIGFHKDFSWYVHSQNPAARKQIDDALNTYFCRKKKIIDRLMK